MSVVVFLLKVLECFTATVIVTMGTTTVCHVKGHACSDKRPLLGF